MFPLLSLKITILNRRKQSAKPFKNKHADKRFVYNMYFAVLHSSRLLRPLFSPLFIKIKNSYRRNNGISPYYSYFVQALASMGNETALVYTLFFRCKLLTCLQCLHFSRQQPVSQWEPYLPIFICKYIMNT